jgi:hypothetical protein
MIKSFEDFFKVSMVNYKPNKYKTTLQSFYNIQDFIDIENGEENINICKLYILDKLANKYLDRILEKQLIRKNKIKFNCSFNNESKKLYIHTNIHKYLALNILSERNENIFNKLINTEIIIDLNNKANKFIIIKPDTKINIIDKAIEEFNIIYNLYKSPKDSNAHKSPESRSNRPYFNNFQLKRMFNQIYRYNSKHIKNYKDIIYYIRKLNNKIKKDIHKITKQNITKEEIQKKLELKYKITLDMFSTFDNKITDDKLYIFLFKTNMLINIIKRKQINISK